MLASTPKFRVPDPCPERLRETSFVSYSLSSCVAALFELNEIPERWEEMPDWHERLVRWAGSRGLQIVELDYDDDVAGYNLRAMSNPDHVVTGFDGRPAPGIEFLLFFGDTLQFNPSKLEILPANLLPGKIVFLPLDPAPWSISYN